VQRSQELELIKVLNISIKPFDGRGDFTLW